MINIAFKQRTLEHQRKIADRLWTRLDDRTVGKDSAAFDGDSTKLGIFDNFVRKWSDFCARIARSERVEDRIFAAEQIPKLYEADPYTMGDGLISHSTLVRLAIDPDLRVRTAFIKGACSHRNIERLGGVLIKSVAKTKNAAVLESIREGLVTLAKCQEADDGTKAIAAWVLINVVLVRSHRLGSVELQERVARDLETLDNICLTGAIGRTLRDLNQEIDKMRRSGQITSEMIINDSGARMFMVVIELINSKELRETTGELIKLVEEPLLPGELRAKIREALTKFGVVISWAVTANPIEA